MSEGSQRYRLLRSSKISMYRDVQHDLEKRKKEKEIGLGTSMAPVESERVSVGGHDKPGLSSALRTGRCPCVPPAGMRQGVLQRYNTVYQHGPSAGLHQQANLQARRHCGVRHPEQVLRRCARSPCHLAGPPPPGLPALFLRYQPLRLDGGSLVLE